MCTHRFAKRFICLTSIIVGPTTFAKCLYGLERLGQQFSEQHDKSLDLYACKNSINFRFSSRYSCEPADFVAKKAGGVIKSYCAISLEMAIFLPADRSWLLWRREALMSR